MALIIPPRVSDRAFAQLAQINDLQGTTQCLRVAVKGGGCSGFQYEINLDHPLDDDLLIEKDGQCILIDKISLPFLENAEIDYSDEIIGAKFVVTNPNAKSTCGCSLSFSL